jgi:hypothetical protein
MDTALGLADGLKHVIELGLSRHQERDAVVVREADINVTQRLHYQ